MYKKNQIIELDIIDFGNNLEGIAKKDNFVFFVKGAIIGEKVLTKITKVGSKFAYARMLQIVTKSPARTKAECQYFGKCGGCHCMHMNIDLQKQTKRNIIINAINKYTPVDHTSIQNITNETINIPTIPYRNKIQLPIGYDKQGKLIIGFFRENSNEIIDIDECIISINSQNAITAIKEYITQSKDTAYFGYCYTNNHHPNNHYFTTGKNQLEQSNQTISSNNSKSSQQSKGNLRHIVVRTINHKSIITVVCRQGSLKNEEQLCIILDKYFDNPVVFINTNNKDNNTILGDEYRRIDKNDNPTFQSLNIQYQLHPAAFLQVNQPIAELLYNRILQTLQKNNIKKVIDAYSGIGILSAIIAKQGILVQAIEIVQQAHDTAQQIKSQNDLTTLQNIVGDANQILPQLLQSTAQTKKQTNDIDNSLNHTSVILDPPRKGCDTQLLQVLNQSQPLLIIYVSCNSSTLARDLNQLISNYHLESLTPYDMFFETKHIETLAVLRRK